MLRYSHCSGCWLQSLSVSMCSACKGEEHFKLGAWKSVLDCQGGWQSEGRTGCGACQVYVRAINICNHPNLCTLCCRGLRLTRSAWFATRSDWLLDCSPRINSK